ncbi:hypothetical protein ID866_9469 [Astraeus odoratus]|nr:hypothetical protein ID866_9469 [Astraeus odoratus]
MKLSIKLYAWEYAFMRRISHARNDLEMEMLRKIGITTVSLGHYTDGQLSYLSRGVEQHFMEQHSTYVWSVVVAFASFATASVFADKPLTADVIFPAISVFMLIQFPLSSLSDVMSSAIEAMTSARRLSHFFRAEELQDTVTRVDRSSLSTNDEVLSIKGGEFTWSKDKIGFVLEDINLSVRKGELVGVLGHIGSGKSSLLSAIIGDMRRTKGDVALSGSLSYASQNPWILSATIRDNILFSHEYDEVFYNQVIEVVSGITLSGGQRARVALARAAYARADLALLDDVLAAVDAHVARHVFDHVIGPRGLLATKARILVTNNVAYLKYFNQLVYLHEGCILEHDSYLAIMANPRSEIRKLVRNYATGGSSSGVTTPSRTGTYNSIISEIETTTSKSLCWESYQSPPIASFSSVEEVAHSGLSEEHAAHVLAIVPYIPRVLNVFSRDVYVVDQLLARVCFGQLIKSNDLHTGIFRGS